MSAWMFQHPLIPQEQKAVEFAAPILSHHFHCFAHCRSLSTFLLAPAPTPNPPLPFGLPFEFKVLPSAQPSVSMWAFLERVDERTKALTFAAPIRLIPLKSKLYILSLRKFLCLSELFLSSSTHTNDRGKTDRRAMIRMMTMVVMMTKKRRQKVAAYTEIQILNLLTPTRPDNAMPSTLGRATSQENVIVPVPDDVMISPHVDPHGTSR